jgi:hypothetical protein
MAAVVSPLELCSFCRDGTSQESERKQVWLPREDFLEAQQKCYICTWIGFSLTSEALEDLPQKLGLFFDFEFHISIELDAKYKKSGLSVSIRLGDQYAAIKLYLSFYSINNTGMTYGRN